jgi:hypothetical protein
MIMLKYYLYFLLLITHLSLISVPTCYLSFDQETTLAINVRIYNCPHRNNIYNERDNLFAYSSVQLQQYFNYHHYSEKDILSQNMLYMSDEFVQLTRTYPGYEKAITELYKKLKRMWVFQRAVQYLFYGSYYPNLFKRVKYLYKELRQYQHIATENAKSFAQLYDINLLSSFPHNDSLVTRNIYKNYIDILQRAYRISVQNTVIRDCIGQALSIGLEANKNGYINCASQLADFCLTMLDCAAAFDEGIYLGAMQTVDAISHPIETIKNSIIGIGMIAHGLSKLVSIPVECALLYAADRDCFYIQKDVIINQLTKIIGNAMHYVQITPPRNIVKQGSAFITEGILLTKICTFAHNVSKQLLPVAQGYFEYITKKEPMACLADGTIIEVTIPKQTNIVPIKNNILKMESAYPIPMNISKNIPSISHNIQEVFNAIAAIEPNRIHHILTPTTGKHAWCKVCKNPLNWEEVKNIIAKVMLHGEVILKKKGYEKILTINEQNIVVRYIYELDGTLLISNAWVTT